MAAREIFAEGFLRGALFARHHDEERVKEKKKLLDRCNQVRDVKYTRDAWKRMDLSRQVEGDLGLTAQVEISPLTVWAAHSMGFPR